MKRKAKKTHVAKSPKDINIKTVRYARLYKTAEYENHRFEVEADVPLGRTAQQTMDELRLWVERQNDRTQGDFDHDINERDLKAAIASIERYAATTGADSIGFEQCVSMLRSFLEIE